MNISQFEPKDISKMSDQELTSLSISRLSGKIKERRLTQEQVAEMIGVSSQTMSNWLTERCSFDFRYIFVFNKVLRLTPEEKRSVWLADVIT